MEDDHKDQDSLTADELIAVLAGQCEPEAPLGRIMGLLGLAVAEAGGKLQLKLDGLKELDGKGLAIAIDQAPGTATVVLFDPPRAEGEANTEPTHPASTTRH